MGLYPIAGTLPRAWWTSHVAFSLEQHGIRHGCFVGTTSTWFPVSNLFSTLSPENIFMVTMISKRLADESVYDTQQQLLEKLAMQSDSLLSFLIGNIITCSAVNKHSTTLQVAQRGSIMLYAGRGESQKIRWPWSSCS